MLRLLLALVAATLACSGGSSPAPVPPPAPTPGGSSCYTSVGRSDCPSGQICSSLFTNHQSAPACLAECSPGANQSDCGPGHVCYPLLGAPDRGACRPGCTQDGDCRDGLSCNTATGQCRCQSAADCTTAFGFASSCRADGFCAIGCTLDADCGCGAVCNSGSCQAGCNTGADCCGSATCSAGRCAAPAGVPAFSRCVLNDDCASGLLCDYGYSRGECLPYPDLTRSCATGACPAGSTCIAHPTSDNKIAISCPKTCTPGSNAGCSDGALCLRVPNDPTQAACFPACMDDAQCSTGMSCNRTTHECACQTDAACAFWGPGATCNASTGECSAPKCVPSCNGTTCGGDGCGGSCSCGSGTQCDSSGQCVRPATGCTRGSDCTSNCCNTSTGACVATSYCQAPPSSCQVSPAGSCTDTTALFCGAGCCPANLPYSCPAAQGCYATQAAAESACGSSTCYQCVASSGSPGTGGSYQPGGQFDGCVRKFYDPSHYNWLAWEDNCPVAVYVAYACAQRGISGAMDLSPGQHTSTGYSASEISGYGGIMSAICGSGYIPVNASDQYWSYGETYRCKHQ
jgi:hypothetical protein